MIKNAVQHGFVEQCHRYGITNPIQIDQLMKIAAQKRAQLDWEAIKQMLGLEGIQAILTGQISSNDLVQAGVSAPEASEIIQKVQMNGGMQ